MVDDNTVEQHTDLTLLLTRGERDAKPGESTNPRRGHEISELLNRTDLCLHWDASLTSVLEQNQSLINGPFIYLFLK